MYKYVINKLIHYNIIVKEDYKIYEYGLKNIVSNIISISLLLVISSIFDTLCTSIVFLLLFVPLRKTIGGFHFKKELICQAFSQIIILLSSIITKKFLFLNIDIIFSFIWIFILLFFLLIKTFSTEKKLLIYSFIILTIYIVLFFISYFFSEKPIMLMLIYCSLLGIICIIFSND